MGLLLWSSMPSEGHLAQYSAGPGSRGTLPDNTSGCPKTTARPQPQQRRQHPSGSTRPHPNLPRQRVGVPPNQRRATHALASDTHALAMAAARGALAFAPPRRARRSRAALFALTNPHKRKGAAPPTMRTRTCPAKNRSAPDRTKKAPTTSRPCPFQTSEERSDFAPGDKTKKPPAFGRGFFLKQRRFAAPPRNQRF